MLAAARSLRLLVILSLLGLIFTFGTFAIVPVSISVPQGARPVSTSGTVSSIIVPCGRRVVTARTGWKIER